MEDLIERPFLWRRVKERNFLSLEASKLKLMSSLSNVPYANCIGCDVSPNHSTKHKVQQIKKLASSVQQTHEWA